MKLREGAQGNERNSGWLNKNSTLNAIMKISALGECKDEIKHLRFDTLNLHTKWDGMVKKPSYANVPLRIKTHRGAWAQSPAYDCR
jgi:hypothetical protein